jgi:hypothetical protein
VVVVWFLFVCVEGGVVLVGLLWVWGLCLVLLGSVGCWWWCGVWLVLWGGLVCGWLVGGWFGGVL